MEKREMRRRAKEVNFGIMYGMGPFGLAQSLGIPQSESKEIITKYFERFPKVKQFIEDTKEFCRRNGYVETMLGRRRYLPDFNSKNGSIRSNAERQAINAPIQGTAADMIKLAMIKIYEAIKNEELGMRNNQLRMLLQVHDELVFDFPKNTKIVNGKVVDGNLPIIRQLKSLMEEGGNDFGIRTPVAAEYQDRKSTRLNSSHVSESRMPSSA